MAAASLTETLSKIASLDRIEDAASALKLIVDTYAPEPSPVLNRRYSSEKRCLELLQREPGLHDILKSSHASRTYEDIRNSVLIRDPGIRPKARKLMDELRPSLKEFIASKSPLLEWTPRREPADSETLSHLTSLGLLTMRRHGPPLVILKDLGGFSEDPVLARRVKNIFVRGKRTVLVNTSGSGKTRLLFEGLCCEWGFYFTSAQDTSQLGPLDLHRIIHQRLRSDRTFVQHPHVDSADLHERLKYNREMANRRLSEALLARLIIFRMFIELVKELGEDPEAQKITWLLLQLYSGLSVHRDIFEDMTTALEEEMDVYTWAHIADILGDIRGILGSDFHPFCVLDEAQVAATHLSRAFEPEPTTHPILVEILRCWDSHWPQPASFVIAGTDVPLKVMERWKDSTDLRWTSDTGAFDDRSLQDAYLRRFLPPALFESSPGQVLLERIWQWTRGRHRFTAALVDELLKSNFQSPHRLLDQYLRSLTGFTPTDGQDMTIEEPVVNFGALDIGSLSFSRLGHPAQVEFKSLIQDVLYHYLTVGHHPPTFTAEKTLSLVSLDWGRFTDEAMAHVRVDEPIMLAGAAVWMNRAPPWENGRKPPHNYLTTLRRDPSGSSKTFAKCLAFYFSRVFEPAPRLCDIFSFTTPVSNWAKQTAELVELHVADDGRTRYSVVSGSDFLGRLATSAHGLDEVIAWMEHAHRTPFCVPASANPDLIFALRLADASFVWVIVQAAPLSTDGSELLPPLEEENLFCDTEGRDPDLSSHARALELLNSVPAGTPIGKTPTVLRVTASLDTQFVLKGRMPKAAPQASLSMDMFREQTAAITPDDFVASVVAGVLGKRKTNDPEVEQGKGKGKGKGKGRAKKRRTQSFSVDGTDEPSEDDVPAEPTASAPPPEASTRVLRPRPNKAPAQGSGTGKGASKPRSKK
ncbi:hypothetical protein C8R46DRAFT_371984 [Mycena filopes]|nr:hypothetical protein C8R46DRAFT_371984 [Mycena filopes]